MISASLLATVAILATAVIFGTDVLAAVVMRPAFAEIDDRSLVQVTGRTHHYGDRRLPVFGIVSVVSAALTTALWFMVGHPVSGVLSGVGLLLLLVWLLLFARISVPINRTLIAASLADTIPDGVREIQARWDSIIVLRSVLQGAAVALFCLSLFLG